MNDQTRYNYLSIAEIRFSPIDNLSEFIHAIQLAFNLANYTDSANIKSQTLQVQEVDQQKLLVPNIQNFFELDPQGDHHAHSTRPDFHALHLR